MSNLQTSVVFSAGLLLVIFATTTLSLPARSIRYQTQRQTTHTTASTGGNEFPEEIQREVRDKWIYDEEEIQWTTSAQDSDEESEECITDGNECPYQSGITPKYNPDAKLWQLSTTPWKFVTNVDQNRFPRRFREACCLCVWCVNYDGDVPKKREHYQSVEVKSQVVVGVRNGTSFKVEKQFVTMGCSCTTNSILNLHSANL